MSILIGIVGGSGSGKTTLADGFVRFHAEIGSLLLSQDDYYRGLPPGTAAEDYNFDEPAALDLEALAADLEQLRAGRGVWAPRYDFALHRRRPEPQRLEPAALIVVEGLFLFASARLRAVFDLKFFVDVPAAECLRRRVARDVRERGRAEAEIVAQFERQVEPMYRLHVEPTRAFADYVLALPHPDDRAYCEQVLEMWRRVEELLTVRTVRP